MTAPQRTEAQRLEALEKANRIRSARAELKRLVKTDRELDVARRVIAHPDKAEVEVGRELRVALGFEPPAGWLESMAVRDLLLACPSVGAVKANGLMRDAWGHLTTTTRRIGGMTGHHRGALAAVLERHAARKLDYRGVDRRQENAA